MKLVELLANELKEWPASKPDSVGQAIDGTLYYLRNGSGLCYARSKKKYNHHSESCSAIVTRPQWEAEKARIAGEETWLRHRGRKCPVQSGTLVDLKLRGGVIHRGKFCDNHAWIHAGKPFDVMYWRLSEPAWQPASVSEEVELANAPDPILAIRDRIYELDTQRAELEATYQHQIGEIAKERGELVGKLAQEGLALVERVQVVEDMNDWRNWRVGDLLEMENADDWDLMLDGKLYEMVSPEDGDNFAIRNDRGDLKSFFLDDRNNVTTDFKWHSRPAS